MPECCEYVLPAQPRWLRTRGFAFCCRALSCVLYADAICVVRAWPLRRVHAARVRHGHVCWPYVWSTTVSVLNIYLQVENMRKPSSGGSG